MFEHRIIYLEEQVEKMSLCVKMLARLAVHDLKKEEQSIMDKTEAIINLVFEQSKK